jgi:pyruvate/2-oxoacid:ferredoxin oxidoreductase alpha subunit
LVYEAFDIADKIQKSVICFTDGALGNMMEAIKFLSERLWHASDKNNYILTKRDREDKAEDTNIIMSCADMQQANIKMAAKYAVWEKNEQRGRIHA